MKKRYPHYYTPSCDQLKEAGKSALFVFDTNALLAILRFSPKLADKTITVIKRLKDRIYIPAHVDYEYHKHILDTPVKMSLSVNDCINDFTFDKIQDCINKVFIHGKNGKKIPADYLEIFTNRFREVHKSIIEELKALKNHYNELFTEQTLQHKISDVLHDRVLPGFTENEIIRIKQEGAIRYANKIPPGIEDKDKDNGNAYGDLIIWKEILGLAIKNKDRSIFFISNDSKEDWLCMVHERIWGPRVELIAEFTERSRNLFYIYTLDQFLKFFGDNALNDTELRVISEMQTVSAPENKKQVELFASDIKEVQTPTIINNDSKESQDNTSRENKSDGHPIADEAKELEKDKITSDL